MPPRSFRLAVLKEHRIEEEWPNIPDSVFATLGVKREKLAELEWALLGRIILPGMPDYEPARYRSVALPQIIVMCRVFEDVRLCLQWARRYGWWVTPRSGGHCTAGYSVNTGMVIDVSGIRHVVVDPERREARIGSGARFYDINSTLNIYGLHIPGGTCPDVGAAGYMQGGGYGFTSLDYGMNCDNVIGIIVMLADGSIVLASHGKNPDLFWAVRGGAGGSFGIVLEIQYQLHPLKEVWGFGIRWPLDSAPDVMLYLQRHAMKNETIPNLGYLLAITQQDAEPHLVMMGVYRGTREEGMTAIAELLNIGAEASAGCSSPTCAPEMRYDHYGTYAMINDDVLENMLIGPPSRTNEVRASGFVDTPPDRAGWEAILDIFAETPNPYNAIGIEPYGGRINSIPSSTNAFIHRRSYMNIFVVSFWAENGLTTRDHAVHWQDRVMETVRPYLSGHVYQNYPEPSFPNFRWAYWGDAYNTLLFVKKKYDPDNFFHFEQSISDYPADPAIARSNAPSIFHDSEIEFESFSKPDRAFT